MEGWTYGRLAASYARLGELEQASSEAINTFILQRRKELETSGVPASTTADLLGNYKDNFRTEQDWEHFREGLRMAGLPD